MEEIKGSLSKQVAVIACIAMTLFYVATLYTPTLVLRLPPPRSFNNFMIQRFICAAVSSVASVIFFALVLPIRSAETSYLFGVYGIRLDHMWQAVLFPLFLTPLMYAGSLMLLVNKNQDRRSLLGCIKSTLLRFPSQMSSIASNVQFWWNLVVAPITEELVFRACMIPLLLCGGFKAYNVIFLCPTFFSLGNLVAPLVARALCNYTGLPVLFVLRKGIVSVAFIAGMLSFAWLLFPLTRPDLYNDRTNNCRC